MTNSTGPRSGAATQSIAQALASSDALSSLTARVHASQARLAALQALLQAPIRAQVRAGPLDSEGFTLLAASQPVAAKLRNMLPALEACLVEQGFTQLPIRVKVLALR